MTALVEQLRALSDDAIAGVLAMATPEELAALRYAYAEFWLRPDERTPGATVGRGQMRPAGAAMWWVLQGGRGSGKSFAAMHWALEEGARLGKGCVLVFMARTLEDAHANLVEGESGILNFAPPWYGLDYKESDGLVTWRSGARAYLYGGDVVGAGRGPNFNRWWIDDLAAFGPNGFKVFRALDKAFRLRTPDGSGSRGVATTTPPGDPPPQCIELVEHFLEPQFDPRQRTFVYSIDPADVNLANLTPNYHEVLDAYRDSPYEVAERKGVYDKTSGPKTFAGIDFARAPIRVTEAPDVFDAITISIDPADSSSTHACEVGITAQGITRAGDGYVLEDASGSLDSDHWPDVAHDLYERWEKRAARIRFVLEVNRGTKDKALLDGAEKVRRLKRGEVGMAIREVRFVTSRVKKADRAAPLVRLYRVAQIRHVHGFPDLETQLRRLNPESKKGTDRADAAVHGLLDLFGLLDVAQVIGTGDGSMQAGAFGRSAQEGIAVGPAERPFTFQQPGTPGPAPMPGAFGRSSW